MLEPTKRDILHPNSETQGDGRRGTIMIKSNPILATWAVHKLKNYERSSPTGVKVLSPTSGSPAWQAEFGDGGGAPRESLAPLKARASLTARW